MHIYIYSCKKRKVYYIQTRIILVTSLSNLATSLRRSCSNTGVTAVSHDRDRLMLVTCNIHKAKLLKHRRPAVSHIMLVTSLDLHSRNIHNSKLLKRRRPCSKPWPIRWLALSEIGAAENKRLRHKQTCQMQRNKPVIGCRYYILPAKTRCFTKKTSDIPGCEENRHGQLWIHRKCSSTAPASPCFFREPCVCMHEQSLQHSLCQC